ncbi:MAG: glycine cleavage system protein GcvH [Gammaproteobacteria bacterium]|nr:glycine cleavage system protein GcvH [Gammaproteobacteria bacterium]MBT3725384.1 glycine cleavage system protein GcvH [Gammaproteobacteria bacterium]MBT4078354.1 glycine cleavage system protein GcvH [Gammaproteobacteria bacterium]MBT4195154.1 glycine cleavage system protein GcvH [Gammaproteobacteria bacterium]MBT4448278.1 glycine cleavage system protein GcvH [Gammaproteobacteria bacterium]
MSTLKYTEDHEWVLTADDGTALIGITDFAQEQLGELVFIELPAVGDEVEKEDAVAVIESVKSASDLLMPVSGEIIEVNEELDSDPGIVNEDAMGAGWFIKVKLSDETELEEMMDEAKYMEGLEDSE